MRIGIILWEPGEEMAGEAVVSYSKLGHDVIPFPSAAKMPPDLDIIFAYGPFGSIVPLANQLLDFPKAKRPPFIFWQTEAFPNPSLPKWWVRTMGKLRSTAERLLMREEQDGIWQLLPGTGWMISRGFRYRYCGDLLWLQEEGIITLLVTGSPLNAVFLNALGLDCYLPSIPNHREGWSAELKLERDVPVLWLGKPGTRRRRRHIQRLRRELDNLGIEMMVVDGLENSYVFGEERTRLLNRTRIVLNLLRHPWDSHATRFQLATMNRALVISEQGLNHTGFIPGEHFIEVPLDQITDNIVYYLEHEDERRRIVERAYALISQTSRKMIYRQLLKQTFKRRASADGQVSG